MVGCITKEANNSIVICCLAMKLLALMNCLPFINDLMRGLFLSDSGARILKKSHMIAAF